MSRPLPVIVTKRAGQIRLQWVVRSNANGGQVECNFAAECGRVVMRSDYAMVTACLVDSIDDITYGHAENNGRVCRAFAGADGEG